MTHRQAYNGILGKRERCLFDALYILIVDDVTVIGDVDDALIPVAAGMAGCGVAFMGKDRRCEICGEEYYRDYGY